MTQVIRRRDPLGVIADNHTRIRRIEATPAQGGGSSGDCPDCVLDPFTVNLGDITVPPLYRNCVDVSAHSGAQETDVCGTGNVFIVSGVGAGYCSGYALGKSLGLQLRAVVAFGCIGFTDYGPASNMANLIMYAGNPETQAASFTWDVAGSPDQAPCDFDTGWTDVPQLCGGSCTELTASVSFQSYSSFTGGCASGVLYTRWVELNPGGKYRGALDDLPQADTDGDVIYFSSETHEFTTGPARRRTSYFMG